MSLVRFPLLICFFLLALFSVSQQASACPLISGQVDFNCDQIHKIVFVGDSIVRGRGDTKNGEVGGYVRRLKFDFPESRIINYGHPGFTAYQVLKMLKQDFVRGDVKTERDFREADLIVIDIGRNAFWKETTPATVVKNIRRIAKFLRRELAAFGVAPYIVLSTNLKTNRGFQEGYIREINELLLAQNSAKYPVLLHFHTLPRWLLGGDGLHPRSKGYQRIKSYIAKIFRTELPGHQLVQRPDADSDGVFDMFERKKFNTSAKLADTDSDGSNDGEELFIFNTDPLDFDDAPDFSDDVEDSDSEEPAPSDGTGDLE